MFYTYYIPIYACKLSEKRTGKKSNEFDKEEVKHLTDIEVVKATNEGLFFVCSFLQSF